jgi:hypothetical protein
MILKDFFQTPEALDNFVMTLPVNTAAIVDDRDNTLHLIRCKRLAPNGNVYGWKKDVKFSPEKAKKKYRHH